MIEDAKSNLKRFQRYLALLETLHSFSVLIYPPVRPLLGHEKRASSP